MKFGIMFFGGRAVATRGPKYKLVLDAARYADSHGFGSVWTPERHFDEFGGLYPNPSVLGAGIATITNQLQIRSGSLISPLHHTVRIAEEWSVVDNLSNGRVGISFGSGWNVNDFVFFPERYEKRQACMYEQIEAVRKLWRGESMTLKNSYDKDVTVKVYPQPVSPEVPVWVTTSGNPATFISAGKTGSNLLTHLIGQDLDTLGEKIKTYRQAREKAGYDPETGIISLMLHTYMAETEEEALAVARKPFREYLRTAVKLELQASKGGGTISGGHKIDGEDLSKQDMEDLLDVTFERYYQTGSLIGTVEHCQKMVDKLQAIGVNDAACLVDFLEDHEAILKGLHYLNQLRTNTDQASGKAASDRYMTVDQFLAR